MLVNKELIARIKFIGKIQIGDKINIKNMCIQPDGYLTQISRSILQDNRNKTLVFLQDTFFKTFEILRCYEKTKQKSDKIMCMNLINDLRNSKNGLLNLKETYVTDIKFVCDIDVLMQIIEATLIEIENKNVISPLSTASSPPSPLSLPIPSFQLNDDED